MRLSASLLLALALFTNTGCNEGSNVADNNQQPRSIAQQALDNMPADVREALEAKEANEASIMSIEGVNGIGVGLGDDDKARIVVLTERENVSGIPNKIGGVKVKIEHVGKIEALGKPGTGGAPKPTPGYTGNYGTTAMPVGVSIGNNNECAAGTLGCVVKSNVTGERLLLSNWHVLSGNPADGSDGGTINQPGLYDAPTQCNANGTNQIATTSASQLYPISSSVSNKIDAGLASINSGVIVTKYFPDGTSPSTTAVAPVAGMAVRKVGRTTGVTTGTIGATNATIRVQYDGFVATFTNQIYVRGTFIKSGDSGSLMTTNNSAKNPVGLCFAGSSNSSYANPISEVLSLLNVSISDN
jgi:hypothetical protein